MISKSPSRLTSGEVLIRYRGVAQPFVQSEIFASLAPSAESIRIPPPPLICNREEGALVPIPIFSPIPEIADVRVSSSRIPFTILFHAEEESQDPEETVFPTVSPVERVAYPTESAPSVAKKVMAERKDFFKKEGIFGN